MRPLFTRLATVSPVESSRQSRGHLREGETGASRAGVLCQARCQIAATSLGEDWVVWGRASAMLQIRHVADNARSVLQRGLLGAAGLLNGTLNRFLTLQAVLCVYAFIGDPA